MKEIRLVTWNCCAGLTDIKARALADFYKDKCVDIFLIQEVRLATFEYYKSNPSPLGDFTDIYPSETVGDGYTRRLAIFNNSKRFNITRATDLSRVTNIVNYIAPYKISESGTDDAFYLFHAHLNTSTLLSKNIQSTLYTFDAPLIANSLNKAIFIGDFNFGVKASETLFTHYKNGYYLNDCCIASKYWSGEPSIGRDIDSSDHRPVYVELHGE